MEKDIDYDVYWKNVESLYLNYPSVRHRRRFILKQLEAANINPDFEILDYGCGDGSLLREIKMKFNLDKKNLHGFDISTYALNNLNDICTTHLKIPLEKKFDFIICSEVIEHTKDYEIIINEIYNHLKVNGLLLLTTQSGKIYASDKLVGHVQHFKIKKLYMLLRKHGFGIKYKALWGFPFFSLQKKLTDLSPRLIETKFINSDYSIFKRIIFEIAYYVFFLNVIKKGPQIYMVAVKRN